MFRIIISKDEAYQEAAALMAGACLRGAVAAEITDVDGIGSVALDTVEAVFFLTNDPRVGGIAADLALKGVDVLNGAYLVGDRSKSFAQKQVRAAGIHTPRLIDGFDIVDLKNEGAPGNLTFPMYIKSEGHVQGAFRIETASELKRIAGEIDAAKAWYVEEAVDAPDRRLEKSYWVAGACFGRDETPREDICAAMDVVGKALSLDVFSADFIVGEKAYWCIDVNPAPGLFRSVAAREAFVDLLRSRPSRGR